MSTTTIRLLSFLFSILLSNLPPSSAQQQPLTLSSFNISNSPWLPTENQILLSPKSVFAAGFKAIPNSQNHYTFSVWYHNLSINEIVWSTNESTPVNASAPLFITASGNLTLNDISGHNVWPSSASGNPNSTSLSINYDGNLIFSTWQSFNFPTDTILPTQNISGTQIISKNGKYSFSNSTSLVLINSTESYWAAGKAFQQLDENGKMAQDSGGAFITSDFGATRYRRLKLDNDGNLKIYSFDTDLGEWIIVWKAVEESCKIYGTCGPNAICISDGSNSSTSCVCPPGFSPNGNATEGCEIKIPIKNPENTKFLQLDYVNYTSGPSLTKLINANNFTFCQASCKKEANCLGFGFKYDGKGYCALQLERLVYGYWSPGTEAAMFLRVDSSEKDQSKFSGMTNLLETTCPVKISLPLPPEESNTTTRNIVIVCTLFAAELISGVIFFWGFLKRYIKYREMAQTLSLELLPAGGPKRFTYAELKTATGDFSNLIGRGGFGDVYKGELTDHRVVAVKVLKHVTGGDAEFWAEGSVRESEDWYFPRWAFDKVFKEFKVEDILDSRIKHSYDSRAHFNSVDRMVKTAMWCLQDQPEIRPSMGKVAKMLEGTVEITEPKKPTIYFLGAE
ncbi:hypothetical protein CMV_028406 [Castanea mollissima]|uniref:Non-specific serine/threonine protein kinase n=1 Tax=Castanea mollissima TaxID=60419 RepID=A0A8J4QFA1_9ROSI|nr:hypothetical protein CMV_028406 [Castanea mollissima]